MTGNKEEPAPPHESVTVDELADKLIERRERLAYFLITGGTTIIAFTVTQLNEKGGPLREASIPWLSIGWLVLLLSAGSSLMLIWKRHQSYALYIGWLYGREGVSPQERARARRGVDRWQMAALAFFFAGSVIEIATWAFAVRSASG
jgi:hypothetical protein